MGTAIYCRISSDPTEREAGVKRQEADCRELAARHGLNGNILIYTDNDTSASQPMENRPAFMQMLSDAQEGLVTSIIAWRDDRLWRNVEHKSQVFAIARESGVQRIITMDQAYDPTNIGDQLVSTMKAAVAEYEAASTKLRVTRALRERAVEGKPHGGVRAFGWKADKLTIDPTEAELVQEAATRILNGEPLARVCQDWNDREIPTVSGGIWRPRTLRAILENPRLMGKRVHQGEIIGDAVWPAILDEATFKRMQRMFQSRVRGPNPDKHLLSGLLYCANCDDRLAAGITRGKRLYRTHRQGVRVNSCGLGLSVPAEPLEALIRDAIIERLSGSIIPTTSNEDSQPIIDELEAVRERLDELNQMWAAGEITRAERATLRQELTKRSEALQADLTKLVAPTLPQGVSTDRDDLTASWEASDTAWRRQLLKALIIRVEVEKSAGPSSRPDQRINIIWRA